MTWYALQYKPAQGDRALQHLQNQDITCFYPKITVEKIKAGKRTKKLEPLFPGYLFVNLEQSMFGVPLALVSTHAKPLSL